MNMVWYECFRLSISSLREEIKYINLELWSSTDIYERREKAKMRKIRQ